MTSATTRRAPRAPASWPRHFLAALEEHGSINAACRATGVHKTTVWRRRQRHEAFEVEVQRRLAEAAAAVAAPPVHGSTTTQSAAATATAPAAVVGADEYWHPRWGSMERPADVIARMRSSRGWGLIVFGGEMIREIADDGTCRSCGWRVPRDRQWLHVQGLDDRMDVMCPLTDGPRLRDLEAAASGGGGFWERLGREVHGR
jgi:hypothetical protein